MSEVEVRRCLNGSPKYDCLFDDKIAQRFRTIFTARPSRLVNAVTRLEKTQTAEPVYFWEEPGRSSLLTFIYWISDGVNWKMEEQNRRTLERFPDNVPALTMKLRILIRGGGKYLGVEARSILDKLTKLDDDSPVNYHQMLACEGEIAYAFLFLGPSFYGEALERYRSVIRRYNENETSVDAGFTNQICSWHFHIARTYDRLLNVAIKHSLVLGMTIKEVYDAICENLFVVLESDNMVYKGKAMIELVDAYKKCRKLMSTDHVIADDGEDNLAKDDCNESIKFPYQQTTTNEFVEQAMRQAPEDPYVLERCGRYLRQHAGTLDEYKRAVDVLDRCKSSHVAWHQKGICYVAMSTTIRNEIRSSQNYTERGARNVGYRGGRGYRGVAAHRSQSQTGGEIRTTSWVANREQAWEQKTLYMTKAKECFQEAIRLAGGTCCLYLVELARAFISLNATDEAEKCFSQAEQLTKLPEEVDYDDNSFLFEQWAFMKARQATSDRNYNKNATSVAQRNRGYGHSRIHAATLYRRSIRAAALGSFRARRSLEGLTDLTSVLPLEDRESAEALKLENRILSKTLEHYANVDGQPLVEAVRQSVEIADLVWQVIKLMTKSTRSQASRTDTHKDNDYTVFMYLTVLQVAGKLRHSVFESEHGGSSSLHLALEIARRVSDVENAPTNVAAVDARIAGNMTDMPIREIYRWVVNPEMRMSIFDTTNDDSMEFNADVAVIAAFRSGDAVDASTRQMAEFIVTLLKRRLALDVFTNLRIIDGTTNAHDIQEMSGEEEDKFDVQRMINGSKSVVVVVAGDSVVDGLRQFDIGRRLLPVLERFYEKPSTNVCFLMSSGQNGSKNAGSDQRFEKWPIIIADEEDRESQSIIDRIISAFIG